MSQKAIVIVGAGGAGSQIARGLSQQLDPHSASILLIEQREFYVHYPATLRMVVSSKGQLEEKALIPYDKLFPNGNGKLINAVVSSISPNENGRGGHVSTESGDKYPYDILVLATGSIWEGPLAFPASRTAAIQFIEDWRKKFQVSKEVAIVGGGAVGSELAGEIRDVYTGKKVVLVQRDHHLLSSVYPDKYRLNVDKRWSDRGIELLMDDEVTNIPTYPASGITTKRGSTLGADLVVPCRGGRPNTALISSLGNNVLNSTGHVKVDQHLQVKGFPGIFAAGDIIDWKEVKQVVKCAGHTTTIISNVKAIVNGAAPSAVYKPMFEVLALTNGETGGATYMDVLWGLQLGNWLTRTLKSKELFVSKTRQSLGY